MDSVTSIERIAGIINRTGGRNGRPFDPATSMSTPSGRLKNWAHYGVMVPDLPAPHRFFGVMSILGTPGVAIFANDHAITSTPADTVYVSSATGSMTDGQFFVHEIVKDCEFRSDGSRLKFGDELLIEGAYPKFALRRRHPEVEVDLEIDATDVVSHFAHIPGLYDHWSVLARCRGTITDRHGVLPVDTLCTVEYATGVGLHSVAPGTRANIPVPFFTYHVLNIDERTQVLLVQVLGPAGLPIQRRVYVRGLGDHGSVHTRGFEFTVGRHLDRTTPTGSIMRLPEQLSWRVADDRGNPLISIDGVSNHDYSYGLGAGFVGSYDYTGTFAGRAIAGTAYMEYIDRR
ncbi:DUF6670 family protein [Nocardia sp. NPDC057668]|uniref:DUF6670 family protein n=1 Tax=Nocardia sp. NPDC057668 TaxID=3346202 RepID=UPI00366B862A